MLKERINYNNLSSLMLLFLDITYKQMDVVSAMKILIFSNTFYIEYGKEDDIKKEYLQNGVSNHQIWHDIIFWEKVIYECIQEQFREQKHNQKNINLTREIVYTKLCSLQLDMLSFEI